MQVKTLRIENWREGDSVLDVAKFSLIFLRIEQNVIVDMIDTSKDSSQATIYIYIGNLNSFHSVSIQYNLFEDQLIVDKILKEFHRITRRGGGRR